LPASGVVCGNSRAGSSAPRKLSVAASIGLAERLPGETMKDFDRADANVPGESGVAGQKQPALVLGWSVPRIC